MLTLYLNYNDTRKKMKKNPEKKERKNKRKNQ